MYQGRDWKLILGIIFLGMVGTFFVGKLVEWGKRGSEATKFNSDLGKVKPVNSDH